MANKKESPSWIVNLVANSIAIFITAYVCMLTLDGLKLHLSYNLAVASVVSLKLLYLVVVGLSDE